MEYVTYKVYDLYAYLPLCGREVSSCSLLCLFSNNYLQEISSPRYVCSLIPKLQLGNETERYHVIAYLSNNNERQQRHERRRRSLISLICGGKVD